jgi:hypothetical protein
MAALVAAILVSPKQHLYAIAPQQTTLATQLSTSAQQRGVIALALLRFLAMIVVLLCLSTLFYRSSIGTTRLALLAAILVSFLQKFVYHLPKK